jgi:hypothetical protein
MGRLEMQWQQTADLLHMLWMTHAGKAGSNKQPEDFNRFLQSQKGRRGRAKDGQPMGLRSQFRQLEALGIKRVKC